MEALSSSQESVEEKKEDPPDKSIISKKRTSENKTKATSMILPGHGSSSDHNENSEHGAIAARAREIMGNLQERRETLRQNVRAGRPILKTTSTCGELPTSHAVDSSKQIRSGVMSTAMMSTTTTTTRQPYSFVNGKETEMMAARMQKVLQERRDRLNRILAGLNPDGREDDVPPPSGDFKASSSIRTETVETIIETNNLRTSKTDARDAGSAIMTVSLASGVVLSLTPATAPVEAESPFRNRSDNATTITTKKASKLLYSQNPPTLNEIGETFHKTATEDTSNSADTSGGESDDFAKACSTSRSPSSRTAWMDEDNAGGHTISATAKSSQQLRSPSPQHRIPIDADTVSSGHETEVRKSPSALRADRNFYSMSPISPCSKPLESSILFDLQEGSGGSSLGRVYSFEDTLATSAKEDPSIRMMFSFNSTLLNESSASPSSPKQPKRMTKITTPTTTAATTQNKSQNGNDNTHATTVASTSLESANHCHHSQVSTPPSNNLILPTVTMRPTFLSQDSNTSRSLTSPSITTDGHTDYSFTTRTGISSATLQQQQQQQQQQIIHRLWAFVSSEESVSSFVSSEESVSSSAALPPPQQQQSSSFCAKTSCDVGPPHQQKLTPMVARVDREDLKLPVNFPPPPAVAVAGNTTGRVAAVPDESNKSYQKEEKTNETAAVAEEEEEQDDFTAATPYSTSSTLSTREERRAIYLGNLYSLDCQVKRPVPLYPDPPLKTKTTKDAFSSVGAGDESKNKKNDCNGKDTVTATASTTTETRGVAVGVAASSSSLANVEGEEEEHQTQRWDIPMNPLALHPVEEPTLPSSPLCSSAMASATIDNSPNRPLSSSSPSASFIEDDPDDTCVVISEASSFDCTFDDTLSSGYLSASITSERLTSLLREDLTEMSINLLSSIKSFDSALEEEAEDGDSYIRLLATTATSNVTTAAINDLHQKDSLVLENGDDGGEMTAAPEPVVKLESCLLRTSEITCPADSNKSKVPMKKVAFAEPPPRESLPPPPPQPQLTTTPKAGANNKTVSPRKPPLEFVPEEVADTMVSTNGGLYSIATASGLDMDSPPSSMEVKIRIAPKGASSGYNGRNNSSRFVMRLDPDFRCGAKGSMYDICTRSGFDVNKPWDWGHNKRSFMRVQGGMLDMALQSGLTPELLHSHAPLYIKTKPLSLCRKNDAQLLPEDVTDYDCGATGNLYLAFESGGGDYVTKGSLYYLATQSGMKLNQ